MGDHVRVERAVSCWSPKQIFQYILQVENYAQLMPNVKGVKILESQGTHRISHWDTEIEGAPLIWKEKDTIRHEQLRLEFDAIEGDFELFRGCWEVVPQGAEKPTLVAFDLVYSIGIAVIEEIVGPILKEKITENIGIMLDGLVQGIEAA
jgi:ribosome-associated toxin RatA of RatAB toxin-antitoxin module